MMDRGVYPAQSADHLSDHAATAHTSAAVPMIPRSARDKLEPDGYTSRMLGPISDKARDLIFKFEDLDQPGEWPGGESGVTIGIGYDLGFATSEQFKADWSD